MCLSYILNPSPLPSQTTLGQLAVPAPVPVPAEAAPGSAAPPDSSHPMLPSKSPSSSRSCSPSLSNVEELVPTCFIPDFSPDLPDLLPHTSPTPYHGSKSPEIPPTALSVPQLSDNLLPSSASSNSSHQIEYYHDASNSFRTSGSPMNQEWTELTSLSDCRPTSLLPLRSSAVPPRALDFPPNSSIANQQSHRVDVAPSSSTVIRQPIPQHPKMALSYILNPSSPIRPEPVAPKPIYSRSRSPSPPLSEFEFASAFPSGFPSNRLTVLPSHSPHDHSPLASPLTTPPSSPPPGPPPMPDLPDMMEPPQLLPWEGPPPPGLDARNHGAYQRAGVHWMLAQIFGPNIG